MRNKSCLLWYQDFRVCLVWFGLVWFGFFLKSRWYTSWLFIFIFIYLNTFYLFMAVLGLRFCARAFSSCGKWGPLFIAVRGASHCSGFSCCGAPVLVAQASVVVACGLYSTGSVVVAHGLNYSEARGIFPDQGSNPCPLHWQADS